GFGSTSQDAVQVTESDLLEAQGYRLHTRGASLIHGIGRHLLGNAASDRYLASRVGAIAGLARAAKNRFPHLRGIHIRPVQSRFGRDHAKIGRCHASQLAAKLAYWGPKR